MFQSKECLTKSVNLYTNKTFNLPSPVHHSSRYNVSFALNITKTFLVSYPRSGNSWTRYLIEGASGVATAAIYPKEKLYHFGQCC